MYRRSGFTLVDTLFAIVLLEVALLGLAGALASGERLLARGRLATRAAERGRELLARIARTDTVCAAASGARPFQGARITWSTGPSPGLRQVTAIIDLGPAAPESLGTVVHCP